MLYYFIITFSSDVHGTFEKLECKQKLNFVQPKGPKNAYTICRWFLEAGKP